MAINLGLDEGFATSYSRSFGTGVYIKAITCGCFECHRTIDTLTFTGAVSRERSPIYTMGNPNPKTPKPEQNFTGSFQTPIVHRVWAKPITIELIAQHYETQDTETYIFEYKMQLLECVVELTKNEHQYSFTASGVVPWTLVEEEEDPNPAPPPAAPKPKGYRHGPGSLIC